MSKKQKEKYVRDGGCANHEFQANVPLGKTKIAELFKKGAKLLGLEDPDDFYPHYLRAMFITSLANDPNLSAKEIMSSARHNSYASTASYMVADGESETHKFKALGMKLPPGKKSKHNHSGVDENGEYFQCRIACIFYLISHILFTVFRY